MQRLCVGIFVLILVDIIWVASAELTEYLFKSEGYKKPYFSTFVKSSMFVVYLIGFLVWRPWRQQCTKELTVEYMYVDPNQEENPPLYDDALEVPISDPTFVPIRFHDGGDKSSGTESDDQASMLSQSRSVRFSKVTEVRQLSESQAEDAVLARLSYTASVRAHELAQRLASRLTVRQVARLAAFFCPVWFIGNIAYQEALADTEAGVVNALSSTSGLFTLLLAASFPTNASDRFTLSKLVAVLVSVGGVTMICRADVSFEHALPSGAMWSIVGALFYAVYLVLLRRSVENEDRMDIAMFFGFVGLFSLLCLWPGVLVLHYTGLEKVEWPSGRQWLLLVLNGFIGTVLSEFLWLWGCFLTSSLIATLSLSLVIPMTMATDMLLKKIHYDASFFIGTVPVFLAFFATALLAHRENWDPVTDALQRLFHVICLRRKANRLIRDADREQSESLIGINSNEEHDA